MEHGPFGLVLGEVSPTVSKFGRMVNRRRFCSCGLQFDKKVIPVLYIEDLYLPTLPSKIGRFELVVM